MVKAAFPKLLDFALKLNSLFNATSLTIQPKGSIMNDKDEDN